MSGAVCADAVCASAIGAGAVGASAGGAGGAVTGSNAASSLRSTERRTWASTCSSSSRRSPASSFAMARSSSSHRPDEPELAGASRDVIVRHVLGRGDPRDGHRCSRTPWADAGGPSSPAPRPAGCREDRAENKHERANRSQGTRLLDLRCLARLDDHSRAMAGRARCSATRWPQPDEAVPRQRSPRARPATLRHAIPVPEVCGVC